MIPANKRPAAKKGIVVSAALMAAILGVLVDDKFTTSWEGLWLVAKVDKIGTGHPVTYCYGQTDELGEVKVGQRFTRVECDQAIKNSLPQYVNGVARCLTRSVPVKVLAAFADGAYNAGVAAMCRSPMVAKANAGDLEGACEAFEDWYIRSAGVVRKGLIARRGGLRGDPRKSERELCFEGVRENVYVQ